MTIEDRIADVLRTHHWSIITHQCRCDDPGTPTECPAHVAQVLAAELHPVIETVEQLDALPERSVIRTQLGRVFVHDTDPGYWWQDGDEQSACTDEIDDLPARLIYSPDWIEK